MTGDKVRRTCDRVRTRTYDRVRTDGEDIIEHFFDDPNMSHSLHVYLQSQQLLASDLHRLASVPLDHLFTG